MAKTTISQLERSFASFFVCFFSPLGREVEMVNEEKKKRQGKELERKGEREEHLGLLETGGGSQLSVYPSCSADLHCAKERTMGMTLLLHRAGAGFTCPVMTLLPHTASISDNGRKGFCKILNSRAVLVPIQLLTTEVLRQAPSFGVGNDS